MPKGKPYPAEFKARVVLGGAAGRQDAQRTGHITLNCSIIQLSVCDSGCRFDILPAMLRGMHFKDLQDAD